jgi:hypothetical protein
VYVCVCVCVFVCVCARACVNTYIKNNSEVNSSESPSSPIFHAKTKQSTVFALPIS